MKNTLNHILILLSAVNIFFTIFSLIALNINHKVTYYYMLGGTALSIILIFLLAKKNKYGYIGTVLFYGIQIIGTSFIFHNYRYGLVIKWSQSFELIFTNLSFEINLSAIIMFVLGIVCLKKYTKES